MDYKVLYRKYRPIDFENVVGQDHIVTILKNSIISNKIGHAYLFSGTRGTGKTSVAKILAKTVNCINPNNGEKCGKCDICKKTKENEIDIIEIDAASNNGVEEIREIRNNAKLLPNIGKYKVYIIDEVHMLSTGAFNALLKTLEEPPNHVIFILATTEKQKIPLTIISRCQKFEFKKITNEEIYNRLKYIVKKEKIKIDDEALMLISELSDGGLRDAINMLDQAYSDNLERINSSNIYDIIGMVPKEEVKTFIDNIKINNVKDVLDYIDKLSKTGKNYKIFCENVLENLRISLLEKKLNDTTKTNSNTDILFIRKILTLINELKTSLNQKILFEITILETMELLKVKEKEENAPVIIQIDNKINQKDNDLENNNISSINQSKEEKQFLDNLMDIRVNNALVDANKSKLEEINELHKNIINYISNKNYNNISNMLLNAKPIIASDKYVIYELKNKSSEIIFKNNIELIEELIKKVYKARYKVACLKTNEWVNQKKQYLEKRKNKIKYEIIDEELLLSKKTKDNDNYTELEKKAMSLFGTEKIKKK